VEKVHKRILKHRLMGKKRI